MKKQLAVLTSGVILCSMCALASVESPVSTVTTATASTATKASASLSASQVYKKVTAGFEFPAQTDINADMFKDLYKINRAYVKSYQVKMPMMSVHSNEIAVFQVKNKKYMDKVLPKVQARLKAIQTNAFYPEQITVAKKGKVVTKGNYILLVVDENASKIINKFKSTVK